MVEGPSYASWAEVIISVPAYNSQKSKVYSSFVAPNNGRLHGYHSPTTLDISLIPTIYQGNDRTQSTGYTANYISSVLGSYVDSSNADEYFTDDGLSFVVNFSLSSIIYKISLQQTSIQAVLSQIIALLGGLLTVFAAFLGFVENITHVSKVKEMLYTTGFVQKDPEKQTKNIELAAYNENQ